MKKYCPNSACLLFNQNDRIVNDGYFKRKDDSRCIKRYRCQECGKRFSSSTLTLEYYQKKRRINKLVFIDYASGASINRIARKLHCNPKTIARRVIYLGKKSRLKNIKLLKNYKTKSIQIDDLITKENSKLKPLAISLMVSEKSGLLLGGVVSQIPSFGHLAEFAKKKYGFRMCQHRLGLKKLWGLANSHLTNRLLIKSDGHKNYHWLIQNEKKIHITHQVYKSERGCIAGQGELKKVKFDPLFAINHTCAMLRANINRLIRKTWCTTKKVARLQDHVDIFMYYFNRFIVPNRKKKFSLSPILGSS